VPCRPESNLFEWVILLRNIVECDDFLGDDPSENMMP
jgi:hypothetical protein